MKHKSGRQILKDLLAYYPADRERELGIPSGVTSALCEYSLAGPNSGWSYAKIQDIGNWVEKRLYAKR
jgi:hypothetical protein